MSWVTLLAFVVPGHWRIGTQTLGVGIGITITGLSVAVALLIGTAEIFGLIAQEFSLGGAFWTWVAGLNINTLGFAIAGLFVVAWAVALVAWRVLRIEQRFGGPGMRRRQTLNS